MRLMPFFSNHAGYARQLALASAVAALMSVSAVGPSFAGDDGQEPIWTGLGNIVGLTGLMGGKDLEPSIDYRARGRLVLPPKMVLPPPGSADATKSATWPVDPDVERVRKAKEDRLKILRAQSDTQTLRDGSRLTPEQLRADKTMPGEGGPHAHCTSRSQGCTSVPFRNVWESIGLMKEDEVVAGEEPDRDWLTDPPKGFRIPTTTTSTKFDSGDAKKPRDNDPRAALYKAPDEEH
jgi:hypothetical protein